MGKIIRLDKMKNKMTMVEMEHSRDSEAGQKCQAKQAKVTQVKVTQLEAKENFRVFVTSTRLMGNCKMVLFNQSQKYGAEFFDLHFNREGIIDYQMFEDADEGEMIQFLQMDEFREITYEQGLDLLKDAATQNYKFQHKIAWLEAIVSPHLQAAWLRTPRQSVETPKYYLDHLTGQQVAQSYIKAVEQKDSSLIYDLHSEAAQSDWGNRDIYMLNWTHEFDDFRLLKAHIVQETDANDGEKLELVLQVALTNDGQSILEAEIYLRTIAGVGGYRLEKAAIMDVYPIKADSVVNPLQQNVFAAVFSVKDQQQVTMALAAERVVDLSGEFEGGCCYKWFRTAQSVTEAVDLDNSYLAQIILTEGQMLIYSRRLLDLDKTLDYFYQLLRRNCSFVAKCSDTIAQIYGQAVAHKQSYAPPTQQGERYYLGSRYYHHLLALCFMQPNYQCYQFQQGNFVFFEQINDRCVEYSFFKNFAVVNYFNTTLAAVMMQRTGANQQRINELVEQYATDFAPLQALSQIEMRGQGKVKTKAQIQRLSLRDDQALSIL